MLGLQAGWPVRAGPHSAPLLLLCPQLAPQQCPGPQLVPAEYTQADFCGHYCLSPLCILQLHSLMLPTLMLPTLMLPTLMLNIMVHVLAS